MRRRLFTIVSTLAILLCLATIALWLRSYWVFYEIYRYDLIGDARTGYVRVTSAQCFFGQIRIRRDIYPYRPDTLDAIFWPDTADRKTHWSLLRSTRGSASPRFRDCVEFRFALRELSLPSSGGSCTLYNAIFPAWLLVLLFASPFAILLRSKLRFRRRQGRIAAGLCPNCAYDLRASKDRCPECGESMPPAARAG